MPRNCGATKEEKMKETKTVQCYPSDSAINEMTALYSDFGWELISNQRCKELDSRTDNYEYYNTFNKLTFTREKASPWYAQVCELEKQYYAASTMYKSTAQPEKPEFNKACLILFVFWLIPGIIYCISYGAKKKKYEKAMEEWEANTRKHQQEYGETMRNCRKKASELVNA